MKLADKLCCPHLRTLAPYPSARRIGGSGHIWLNANELPFEQPGFAIDSRRYNRYPEAQDPALLRAYADYAGVETTRLLSVRGADEAIELLIRAFCTPGQDRILNCPPTYGMYEISAEIHGVAIRQVPRLAGFELDLAGIKAQLDRYTKLLFLCSPNNPTGNVLPRAQLIELLVHCKDSALVVVDQAYIDFCPEHAACDLLVQHENLVLIRTLSKGVGLAAIRCGFLVADPAVIAVVNKVIAPYPMPQPVAQIACQALSPQGIQRVRSQTAEINRIREWFVAQLTPLPGVVRVYPSRGSFVLVHFEDKEKVVTALAEQGIVTRNPYTRGGGLDGCQRISIGTEAEMQAVLRVLEDTLSHS